MLTADTPLDALSSSMERIRDILKSGGFEVCNMIRHMGEPPQLICCDCQGSSAKYTVVGWTPAIFQADASLQLAFPFAKNTLDGVQMVFQITRCWPIADKVSTDRDPRDAATVQLMQAGQLVWREMTGCVDCPENWGPWCSRFWASAIEERTSRSETAYGQEGTVVYGCAGWQLSIVVG